MLPHKITIFFVVIVSLLSEIDISTSATYLPNIWPYPQVANVYDFFFAINSEKFKVKIICEGCNDTKCPILEKAATRYNPHRFFPVFFNINPASSNNKNLKSEDISLFESTRSHCVGWLRSLHLIVTGGCEEYPYLYMNESYHITVNRKSGALITANSVWGALRGIETFSQLLKHHKGPYYKLHTADIADYPRFPHRGLLIDTSRHYLFTTPIFKTLDAMELNKMNTLHWHIVDTESFPFVSKIYPQLAKKGAFEPKKHVYRHNMISEVIEYARLRGIRVVVEFDNPGHTKSWGKGIPEIVTQCFTVLQKPYDSKSGVLNPARNKTYEVVRNLFKEAAGIFPDQYIHFGGDGVDFRCWLSNKEIRKFMRSLGFGLNVNKLESYYFQRVIKNTTFNRTYTVWDDLFRHHVVLPPDTVVEVSNARWRLTLFRATSAGHRALVAKPWYLNLEEGNFDWKKLYEVEPQPGFFPKKLKKRVIGGEACMWGTFVDSDNLIQQTWPRASAVAERLWSSQHRRDLKEAQKRLEAQICRMKLLGIPASPIGPGFCKYEFEFE